MTLPSHQTHVIAVAEASAVGHARRTAVALAQKLGFDEARSGELALVVTEAGTNLLQHAGGGELLLRPRVHEQGGVEVLSIDKGPGMTDVAQCLRDGYSTGGSRGVGLGSIVRLADRFDIYTRPGGGTAVWAEVMARSRPHGPAATSLDAAGPIGARARVGVVCVAYPGEEVVGDGWAVEEHGGRTSVLLVDGLGHGAQASESALAAIRCFEACAGAPPLDALQAIHHALRGLRGAAGAVLEINWSSREVSFAGLGNIGGSLLSSERGRGLSSHNGILGQGQPRFQAFAYPWPDDGLLVMSSDGISPRWSLDAWPGLPLREPAVIAGVLYREHARRDDVTALVLREASPETPEERSW